VDGLKLETMDAVEMLDVLHYYFETDTSYLSKEQADGISAMRKALYGLYGQTYNYGTKSDGPKSGRSYISGDAGFDFDDPVPFDPTKAPPKPYVAPTNFNPESSNPFNGLLDAPAN
jgi:hypothetical protein